MQAVLGSLLVGLLAAAPPAPQEIAPHVTLFRGEFLPGRQPDGNSIVVDAPQGLVVFDTGRHASHTQALLDAATSCGKPIAAIVNSHWHLDHVGGNVLLRAAYPNAAVYASGAIDAALTGFLANYRQQLTQAIAQSTDAATQDAYRAEVALIDAGKQLGPSERITASGEREIAGRRFDVHLVAPAATAGDVWLYDRTTRTLLAGDLVTLPAPFLDTACPSRWSTAHAQLARTDFRVLVPGHGAPMQPRDLARYRRAFDNLLACAASKRDKASCSAGWIDDAGTLIGESERDAARTLADYYVENVLRGDPARIERACDV